MEEKKKEIDIKWLQDLENYFYDAGQFYFFNIAKFLQKQTLFMDNTEPLILDEICVQDIDKEDDVLLAKLKFEHLKTINKNGCL